MTSEEVRAKLKEILVNDFRVPEAKISDEATFRGTLGMDSLDTVDFIYLVSKSFGLKAELSDFRELHTFARVVEFLTGKLAEGKPVENE
jgi:acyl carrier protein